MSHFRVLLVHKDKDYYEVLKRNYTYEDDLYGMCEPFGYDYLSPMSETMKVKDALRDGIITLDGAYSDWALSEIIQEDETLYCDEGVGTPSERNAHEAITMLNPEYYCTLFDGHL